jgi:hypothetical protein
MDLLRGIDAQTRHLHQPLDCILVLAEQTGHLLVLADLLVDGKRVKLPIDL